MTRYQVVCRKIEALWGAYHRCRDFRFAFVWMQKAKELQDYLYSMSIEEASVDVVK